jgi:hypothetical protein
MKRIRSAGVAIGIAGGLFAWGSVPAGAASTAAPSLTLTPASVIAVGVDPMFGLAVQGSGWYRNGPVRVASPGLSAVCGDGHLGWVGSGANDFSYGSRSLNTDGGGTFNAALVTSGCPAGTYEFQAFELQTPSQVATGSATVSLSGHPTASLTLAPASEVETASSHDVSTTIVITGLAPNEVVGVSAPRLTHACRDAFGVTLTPAPAAANLPGSFYADGNGQLAMALEASSCATGAYPVTVFEEGAAKTTRVKVVFSVTD